MTEDFVKKLFVEKPILKKLPNNSKVSNFPSMNMQAPYTVYTY